MLVKNAEALEVMEKVDTLVVDKTGTLTEGKPRLISIEPFSRDAAAERSESSPDQNLLRLAAALERASEHPLAAAIVAGASKNKSLCQTSKTSAPSPAKASPEESKGTKWHSVTPNSSTN